MLKNHPTELEQPSEISDSLSKDIQDFSLVLGGPLYQLFRRARLEGDHLELLGKRILAICAIGWLPLFILSFIDHTLFGISAAFIYDVEVHVRFLIALPILIYAEVEVHRRMRVIVSQFTDRGIIIQEDDEKFDRAIRSAFRLRNSVWVELGLLCFTIILAIYTWESRVILNAVTWYSTEINGVNHLNTAGWWYVFVSVPLFQFILLRWYFRLFIWFRFLWQVNKLNLHLIPTHPDHAAGIGFLDTSVHAFSPILFAQGCLISGFIASRIFLGGQVLTDFKIDIAGFVLLAVLIMLAPLVMFTPRMAAVKRQGKREYGILSNRYVKEFEQKWINGAAGPDEQLIGSADIQSLADLGNSYAIINDMRLFPFAISSFMQLIIITTIPMLPLLLTIIPISDIVDWAIKTMI